MKYIVLLSCLFLSACDWLDAEWDPTEETFYLHYYKQECDSGLCFRYREDESDSYKSLTESIDGFTGYEWGKNYKLLVKEQRRGSGSKRDLSFIRVLEETAVETGEGSRFGLTLTTSKGALKDFDEVDTYKIYGDKSFRCAADDCTKIAQAREKTEKLSLEFQLATNIADPLLLAEVKCHSAENDFGTECEGESENTYYIAPFKTECMILSEEKLCYQFRTFLTDGEWQTLEVDITGDFVYQWGKQFRIKVIETFDSTKKRLSFKWLSTEEEDSEISTESFRLLLRSGGLSEFGPASKFTSYDLEDGFSLVCADPADCSDDLDTFSGQTDEYVALLNLKVKTSEITPEHKFELELEGGGKGLLCEAPKATFNADCGGFIDDPDLGFEGKRP